MRVATAPTIEELLDVCWTVQMHADRDLAFIFDATGDVMVAIVESVSGQQLPPLVSSPAECWLRAGQHMICESMHSPRSLACWLNACRDGDARLAWVKQGREMRKWWGHGTSRLTNEQVLEWLGV